MTTPGQLRELAAASEPRAEMIDALFVVPGPDVTEVLLIRHGQIPVGESVAGGDEGLTEVGQKQAEALADFLAATRIDAVYASPAQRALQTAEAVAKPAGLGIRVLDALRDVDNRIPPGASMSEALQQEFGEAEARNRLEMLRSGLNFDAFGSLMEPSAAIRGRVADAIDGLIAQHDGGRIAVVTHGPPIAAYVSHVLKHPADFVFYPRLTSITSILARGERRQVHLLNAVPHFGVL
jgi:probable phosphoglycerate mutase